MGCSASTQGGLYATPNDDDDTRWSPTNRSSGSSTSFDVMMEDYKETYYSSTRRSSSSGIKAKEGTSNSRHGSAKRRKSMGQPSSSCCHHEQHEPCCAQTETANDSLPCVLTSLCQNKLTESPLRKPFPSSSASAAHDVQNSMPQNLSSCTNYKGRLETPSSSYLQPRNNKQLNDSINSIIDTSLDHSHTLPNNNNYNYNNGGGGGQYYNYYQNDDGANNGGDDYYARNDDGNNNAAANDDANAANDDANDDMMYATDDAANATDDDGINCFYKDVCHAYMEACGEDMFTDDNYMSYSANYAQYFECAEFNVGNAVSYLGPHCRSDGFTIGIGIYEDPYCSSYIGDMVDMEEVTGQAFDDDYLSPYYPKQCISCMATVSIFNCVFVSFCNVYLFFGSFVLVL